MTDLHKMSAMMKNLFPSTPEQDLAALKAMAQAPMQDAMPAVDYTKQSAEVREGSLQMDKEYSVSDFAKLAGVVGKPSGAELLEPVFEDNVTRAVSHIDQELDAGDPNIAAMALRNAVQGDVLTQMEREELKPYLELFQKLITDASMRARILAMADLLAGKDKKTDERALTKKEIKKRDDYADELPDADFKKRYGKDWEAVKYGTATNMAKKKSNESIKDKLYAELAKYK